MNFFLSFFLLFISNILFSQNAHVSPKSSSNVPNITSNYFNAVSATPSIILNKRQSLDSDFSYDTAAAAFKNISMRGNLSMPTFINIIGNSLAYGTNGDTLPISKSFFSLLQKDIENKAGMLHEHEIVTTFLDARQGLGGGLPIGAGTGGPNDQQALMNSGGYFSFTDTAKIFDVWLNHVAVGSQIQFLMDGKVYRTYTVKEDGLFSTYDGTFTPDSTAPHTFSVLALNDGIFMPALMWFKHRPKYVFQRMAFPGYSVGAFLDKVNSIKAMSGLTTGASGINIVELGTNDIFHSWGYVSPIQFFLNLQKLFQGIQTDNSQTFYVFPAMTYDSPIMIGYTLNDYRNMAKRACLKENVAFIDAGVINFRASHYFDGDGITGSHLNAGGNIAFRNLIEDGIGKVSFQGNLNGEEPTNQSYLCYKALSQFDNVVVDGDSRGYGQNASVIDSSWFNIFRRNIQQYQGLYEKGVNPIEFSPSGGVSLNPGHHIFYDFSGPLWHNLVLHNLDTMYFSGNYDYIDFWISQISPPDQHIDIYKDGLLNKTIITTRNNGLNYPTYDSAITTGGGGAIHNYMVTVGNTNGYVLIPEMMLLNKHSNSNGKHYIAFQNNSISGWSANYLYRGQFSELPKVVGRGDNPHPNNLHILTLDGNDMGLESPEDYYTYYKKIAQTLIDSNNKVMIMFNAKAHVHVPIFDAVEKYEAAAKKIAMELGCGFFTMGCLDFYENGWITSPTDNHYNNAGMRVVDSLLEKALVEQFLNKPTIKISTPATAICVGSAVTFTATTTNIGTLPTYQWKVNGVNVGTNANTLTISSLSNKDIVTCSLTNSFSCLASNTVNSNAVLMLVNPKLLLTSTITASENNICFGTSVIFKASTNAGNANFQWQVNGSNVGTNSNTFATSTLNNSDFIKCVVTDNVACSSPASIGSNIINMNVVSSVTPIITISASTTSLCSGSPATFTAIATNGGAAPIYQWQVNGINIGNNSNTFTTSTINNGDQIKCQLISNSSCASPVTATSNVISMTVNALLSFNAAITVSQNNLCSSSLVTFTVKSNINNAAYQWKLNGVNTGTNINTFSSNAFNNNDVVQCVVLAPASGCNASTIINTNSITLVIYPSITPTINITSSNITNVFCEGQPASYNASITNGGTLPIYQWKRNGINVGTNSATFTLANHVDKDVITCTLISNATCVTNNNIESNKIQIQLLQLNPIVSLLNNNLLVANTGNDITFQWYKDGQLIIGATNSSYLVTTFGSYTVLETYKSCSKLSNPIIVNALITSANNNINIFPNPTSNILNAQTSSTTIVIKSVKLFDVTGKIVFVKTFGSNNIVQIDISKLSNANYIAEFETNIGLIKIKIVKQQ